MKKSQRRPRKVVRIVMAGTALTITTIGGSMVGTHAQAQQPQAPVVEHLKPMCNYPPSELAQHPECFPTTTSEATTTTAAPTTTEAVTTTEGPTTTEGSTTTAPHGHNPVTLCHPKGNGDYIVITVDDNAVFVQGHDQHTPGGYEDVIPAFDYYDNEGNLQHYSGRGDQSILENGCDVPEATTTTAAPTTTAPQPKPQVDLAVSTPQCGSPTGTASYGNIPADVEETKLNQYTWADGTDRPAQPASLGSNVTPVSFDIAGSPGSVVQVQASIIMASGFGTRQPVFSDVVKVTIPEKCGEATTTTQPAGTTTSTVPEGSTSTTVTPGTPDTTVRTATPAPNNPAGPSTPSGAVTPVGPNTDGSVSNPFDYTGMGWFMVVLGLLTLVGLGTSSYVDRRRATVTDD